MTRKRIFCSLCALFVGLFFELHGEFNPDCSLVPQWNIFFCLDGWGWQPLVWVLQEAPGKHLCIGSSVKNALINAESSAGRESAVISRVGYVVPVLLLRLPALWVHKGRSMVMPSNTVIWALGVKDSSWNWSFLRNFLSQKCRGNYGRRNSANRLQCRC